jgi:hypothetical protein
MAGLVLTALLGGVLGACGGTASRHADEPLAWIPASTGSAQIINWSAINSELHILPDAPVTDFTSALGRAGIGPLLASRILQAEQALGTQYGWDVRSLEWEVDWATVDSSAAVLRFTPSTKMSAIEASLRRNQFQRQGSSSDAVWRLPLSGGLSTAAPFNSARIYSSDHVLVASAGPTAPAIRPGTSTLDTDPVGTPIRAASRGARAVYVERGAHQCATAGAVSNRQRARLTGLERPDASILSYLGPVQALRAVAVVVYRRGVDVHVQVRKRLRLLRDGTSIVSHSRYNGLITVHRTDVRGTSVTYQLGSRNLNAETTAYLARDWPFSACVTR